MDLMRKLMTDISKEIRPEVTPEAAPAVTPEVKESIINEEEEVNPLLEEIAAAEHEQWIEYSRGLMASENLSEERVERWKGLMVPYAELSEEMKEKDRRYARKVIEICEKYLNNG